MKFISMPMVMGPLLWCSMLFATNVMSHDLSTSEQSIQVPIADQSGQQWMMQGHICRPDGVDKPQLVIINHGSPASAHDRPKVSLTRCDSEAVQWFVQKHYAVVTVLRLGYGATGGPWTESYSGCNNADYYKAGMETARQIDTIVNYVVMLPNVDAHDVIVVGQSAGGWGTLAYSSMPHPNVMGLINMAGGRGGHLHDRPNSNCKSDRLVEAVARFGKTSTTPMLWVYTGNDSFFNPELAMEMLKAFLGAGGQAQLYRPESYGRDGHQLFFGRAGSEIWGPIVQGYLTKISQTPTK